MKRNRKIAGWKNTIDVHTKKNIVNVRECVASNVYNNWSTSSSNKPTTRKNVCITDIIHFNGV